LDSTVDGFWRGKWGIWALKLGLLSGIKNVLARSGSARTEFAVSLAKFVRKMSTGGLEYGADVDR
jgi:hypothetical protein